MTNVIYKEARALNQEKWTFHFDEYTSVNLSRYKIPQSVYSELAVPHATKLRICAWKLEVISIDRDIESDATNRNGDSHSNLFRSFAIRVAIRYTLRVRIRAHTRTPSEVHFMKLITKVHRTGYFGNTGFGVLKFIFEREASSFHNPHPACAARIVCAHPFYFVSLLRSSLVPSSLFEDKRERTRRASRTLSIEKFYFFFSDLIKGRAATRARVTKSDSITCVCGKTIYGRGSFAVKLRFATHRRRTFQINALIAEICV